MNTMHIPFQPRLSSSASLRLVRCIQAGLEAMATAIAARDTQRLLAELDRHTLADIGVPLNGPRSLAHRPAWDTVGHCW